MYFNTFQHLNYLALIVNLVLKKTLRYSLQTDITITGPRPDNPPTDLLDKEHERLPLNREVRLIKKQSKVGQSLCNLFQKQLTDLHIQVLVVLLLLFFT